MLSRIALCFVVCFVSLRAEFVAAQERVSRIYGCDCAPAQAGEYRSPYDGLNLTEEQLSAAHDLEAAQLRFITWTNFEFPAKVQAIDGQITMAQQEIASLQRRQTNFNRFDRWVNSASPVFETNEDVGLALVAAQQRLAQLQTQRGFLLQQQAAEYRLRQMEVERARLHLRRMF